MPTALDELAQKVQDYIDSIDRLFAGFDNLDHDGRLRLVITSLQMLIADFGTVEYCFNLSMERYVEDFSDETEAYLPTILENNLIGHTRNRVVTPESDLAFAAYYALSLIYKKQGQTAQLQQLCQRKYSRFLSLYPLANEVLSRYYKRIHNYPQALQCDEDAIDELRRLGIVNHGPCISYASTVCRMYDEDIPVAPDQEKLARQYIDAAVAYNPDYSKYYYLRGKLTFYSSLRITDINEFLAACDSALADLQDARLLLRHQQGNHYQSSKDEYDAMANRITAVRSQRHALLLTFQDIDEADAKDRIQRILCSQRTTDNPPPNPNLKSGRKYIFISYTHHDFRSVYCDLLQLYRRKVPFQYDFGLPYGSRWDESVKDLILSENCVGVLFFLSSSTLLSEPVELECKLLREKSGDPRYLTVNLEDEQKPTDILIHCILSQGIEGCKRMHIDNGRLSNFLTVFNDNIKFIPKQDNEKPDSDRHIDILIQAIREYFPELTIGEDVD